MTRFGFHASHEQLPPSALLRAVQAAEQAGFAAAMCSDHFAPWSAEQGESGYAWSWLGAALATTSLSFGVVTAPGQRYHPAITAQAGATLAEMFPGRFWMALGSGQALNEHITGDPWPCKAERNARLRECVDVMRALFAGETVSHDGRVRVDRATLWSRPETPPALVGAAVTPATAREVGAWADGLITVNQPVETLRRVLDAFREGGGEGKPVRVQVHVSWAPTDAEAVALGHQQWRNAVLGSDVAWHIETPADFDQVGAYVREDDMHPSVLASSDPQQHVAWLQELAALGADEVMVHQVPKEQERFLEVYAEQVLPRLHEATGPSA
jgi:coenzyme F420-dependent glucose-6-phosphate dehydrogenase